MVSYRPYSSVSSRFCLYIEVRSVATAGHRLNRLRCPTTKKRRCPTYNQLPTQFVRRAYTQTKKDSEWQTNLLWTGLLIRQDAQLPQRNSALSMHFVVAHLPFVAVITETYVG